MRRAFVYFRAAMLVFLSVSTASAQGRIDSRPIVSDPIDVIHSTGAEDIDPAVERTLPRTPLYRAFIPVSMDLSSHMPRPGDQKKVGSCSAWATAYAARSYYAASLDGRDVRMTSNIPSPNYVYNVARQIQDKPTCQPSTSVYAVAEVLKKGSLSLKDYPYRESECDTPPSSQVIAGANDFSIRGFRLVDINRIDDIKGELAQSNPVIIEFRSTQSFQRHHGANNYADVSFDPKLNDWHAMAVVGYDDRRQAVRVINSWGLGWGDNGFAWIGYNVVAARVRRGTVLDVAPASRPNTTFASPVLSQRRQMSAVVPSAAPEPKIVELNPSPKPKVTEAVPPQITLPPAAKPQTIDVVPSPTPKPTVAEAISPPLRQAIPHLNAGLADLQSLSCAKVTVQTGKNRNVINGFVGSDADLGLVARIAADVPNTSIGDLFVAPWPQCEALQTLDKQLSAAGQPKIDIGPRNELRRGDPLRIEIKSPPQISYLYIAYIQADGSVVNLAQPEGIVARPVLPNRTFVFGDGNEGRSKFTVNEPFGREMIIAIASRSPLFEKDLPAQQTEREYLSALRRALIYKSSAGMPNREITASIKILETRAR
jgi:hypothetical protein